MQNLATPRVPAAALGAAMYESHYLTATDPAGGRALWLRHTALKRPGEPARPTVWLTWFEGFGAQPRALRVTVGEPLGDPGGAWARSPLGELSPGHASGAIEGASWSLAWEAPVAALPYLPARWLYDRRVPRSNGAALIPSATVHGSLTFAGEAPVSVDGWDLMVGHNWGSEHADHWTWVHAGGLGEDRSGWIDLALARVKLGPLLTPWAAGGAVRLGGGTFATRLRGAVRREVVGESTLLGVPLAGGAALELRVTAPAAATVSWDYASPRGPGRAVRNCSIADGSLTLRAGPHSQVVEIAGRVAVEHGSPANSHL